MLQLTAPQLSAIYPNATQSRINAALPSLNDTLRRYNISTIRRVACFLGQLGVESGELRYTSEIWGPTTQQKRYERDFTQAWSKNNDRNKLAFELGNYQKGDGYFFRGGGLIQNTGRKNHEILTERLGYDFVKDPAALRKYPYAAISAGDYWDRKNLNLLADALDVEGITKVVNGGTTHLDQRIDYTNRALTVLGEDVQVEKKKWVPILVGVAVGLALVLVYLNKNSIQKWMQKNTTRSGLSWA